MTYGVPYQGSKNRIAKDIIDQLPTGKRFVDLFAGGCAMTHCAILSGKYKQFLCNDKFPVRGQDVFRQACAGEFNKPEYQRFIGHDEFMRRRYDDCWMIGIWGWNFTTKYIGRPFEKFCQENGVTDIGQLDGMKGIDPHYKFPLQNLKRLQRPAGLDISKIEFTQMDYAEFRHEEGDVVYCDPPYKNTDHRYGMRFDSERFWEWVRTRDFPVYVSEYNAPDDFKSIWEKRRGGVQNPNGLAKNTTHIEHLYNHSKWTR